MYTVYDLHLSAKEIAFKFSSTDHYFIVNDITTCRGYGVTLDEAISDILNYGSKVSEHFKPFLSSLYVIGKVDDLSELKSLYPEHFI